MHDLISDYNIGYVATPDIVAMKEVGKDISDTNVFSMIRRNLSHSDFNLGYALAFAHVLSLGDRTFFGNFRLVDRKYVNIDFEMAFLEAEENISLVKVIGKSDEDYSPYNGWSRAYDEIVWNYDVNRSLIDDFVKAAQPWADQDKKFTIPLRESLQRFLELGRLDPKSIDDYVLKKNVYFLL